MAAKPLDSNALQEMRVCIEKLTHSGQKVLDDKLLKSLKNTCKVSDNYVGRCYQMVMHELQKGHSEVRFSALQIIDELFRRSHCFRELLLSDMQQFMELTIEINKDNPLPLPKPAAKAMKKKALQSIHEWNKKFGETYKRLSLAYNFLKNCIKVDFKELEVQSSIEHLRQVELSRKEREILEARTKKVIKEIEENQPEIDQALTSMENCLSLLLPHPKEFFLDAEDESSSSVPVKPFLKDKLDTGKIVSETKNVEKFDGDDDEESNSDSENETEEGINMREYGVVNPHYSIEIELKQDPEKVKVTEENAVIAENARDLFTILSNRHLTDVKKWINILTKSGSSDKLKCLIDLKQNIENILKKYCELNLPAKNTVLDDSDSDTSDLEEVKPKEDFEETVSEPLPSTSKGLGSPAKPNFPLKKSDWSIISQENDVHDPTSALSTLLTTTSKTEKDLSKLIETANVGGKEKPSSSKGNEKPSSTTNSRKKKLLAVAPKVPFDLDLYHWENEKIPSSVVMTSHPDAHNFWSTSSREDDDQSLPKELTGTARVIEFSGKFNPVKWTCRAPLSTGKLCPRKDRVKCPFHGPIVPRDEMGNICEVDGKLPTVPPEKPKVPDWQDPQFLKDIESQTGIDLTIPEKGRRKGKKKEPKYPGLTDVKAIQNTTYNRLSKKIFNKATMKRVASTLDAIDHKKFRDKFGDQFNYS